MLKNKNGNSVLDRMDQDELLDYVMDNYYGELRDMILENEEHDEE